MRTQSPTCTFANAAHSHTDVQAAIQTSKLVRVHWFTGGDQDTHPTEEFLSMGQINTQLKASQKLLDSFFDLGNVELHGQK